MTSYRFLEAAWMLTIVLVVALMAWALTGCAPRSSGCAKSWTLPC
jgi:hypothetical protein